MMEFDPYSTAHPMFFITKPKFLELYEQEICASFSIRSFGIGQSLNPYSYDIDNLIREIYIEPTLSFIREVCRINRKSVMYKLSKIKSNEPIETFIIHNLPKLTKNKRLYKEKQPWLN